MIKQILKWYIFTNFNSNQYFLLRYELNITNNYFSNNEYGDNFVTIVYSFYNYKNEMSLKCLTY